MYLDRLYFALATEQMTSLMTSQYLSISTQKTIQWQLKGNRMSVRRGSQQPPQMLPNDEILGSWQICSHLINLHF